MLLKSTHILHTHNFKMSDEQLQQHLFEDQHHSHHYTTDSDSQLQHQHEQQQNELIKSEDEGLDYQDPTNAAISYHDPSNSGVIVQDPSEGQDPQDGPDLHEQSQGFVIREQDRWLPIANGELSYYHESDFHFDKTFFFLFFY